MPFEWIQRGEPRTKQMSSDSVTKSDLARFGMPPHGDNLQSGLKARNVTAQPEGLGCRFPFVPGAL
jgi:hypothetical protein